MMSHACFCVVSACVSSLGGRPVGVTCRVQASPTCSSTLVGSPGLLVKRPHPIRTGLGDRGQPAAPGVDYPRLSVTRPYVRRVRPYLRRPPWGRRFGKGHPPDTSNQLPRGTATSHGYFELLRWTGNCGEWRFAVEDCRHISRRHEHDPIERGALDRRAGQVDGYEASRRGNRPPIGPCPRIAVIICDGGSLKDEVERRLAGGNVESQAIRPWAAGSPTRPTDTS